VDGLRANQKQLRERGCQVDRSSQANPVLLGFSAAGSVREPVLLCALTVSNRDLSTPVCPYGEDPNSSKSDGGQSGYQVLVPGSEKR
jgi:hypothetical protein